MEFNTIHRLYNAYRYYRDAPRHVMEYEFDGKRARYTHEMPVDAYTGEAICLEINVPRWGLITEEHLEDA